MIRLWRRGALARQQRTGGPLFLTSRWLREACPTGAIDYVEIYDPGTQLFSAGSTMTNGRYNFQALLLKSGLTLIMGGYDAINTPVYTIDIPSVIANRAGEEAALGWR
jgi:hypothetical protein